jgi:alpha-beta hydrolase superfamily lysophospholipase
MHGGPDRITSATASMEFASRAGTLCTMKVWDDLFHELYNEPEKDKVIKRMLEWVEMSQ